MSDHTTHDPTTKLCECGCGQPTRLATYSSPKHGIVKGQPLRFIHPHQNRINPRKGTPEERFWAMVDKRGPDDCWMWQGDTTNSGYGRLRIDDHTISTHRYSYELHFGPIPEGLGVLHKCDNRPCCNPNHLFTGTALDNNQDMIQKGRQRQPSGANHPFAKLSPEDVQEIRQLEQSGVPQSILALRYGVGRSQINKIVHFRSWSKI